jgi:hypothetical protein
MLAVLRDPNNTRISTAQDRHWVKAKFEIPKGKSYFVERSSGGRVAIKSDIYKIISAAHHQVSHGGRDKTHAAVKAGWSFIPKGASLFASIRLQVSNCVARG